MKQIILTLLVSFSLIGCSSSDDDTSSSNTNFQGTWSGTYTGTNDNGTWSMTVNSDNVINGTSYSAPFDETWQAKGSIDKDGNVVIGAYGESDVKVGEFKGKFNSDKSASGSWKNLINTKYYGTWTGNKN
ncbi:MAG: hypothetical protein H6604_03005 [Flavobacteriales bacterium]|nr:hypothetical protein [Flavobacteriales bacterium]